MCRGMYGMDVIVSNTVPGPPLYPILSRLVPSSHSIR
jgi:hypothetical protein